VAIFSIFLDDHDHFQEIAAVVVVEEKSLDEFAIVDGGVVIWNSVWVRGIFLRRDPHDHLTHFI
jgi:hypothetical protein